MQIRNLWWIVLADGLAVLNPSRTQVVEDEIGDVPFRS